MYIYIYIHIYIYIYIYIYIKKQRTKQTNAPGEEREKTGTKTAANGGRPGRHGPARDAGDEPDHGGMGAPKGKPPHPTAALPCACVVLASCLRHACCKGKTTGATRRRTVAESGPPPCTTWQGREAAERGCGTDHATVPKGSTRRASPNGETTGAATARRVGRRPEPHR